MHKRNKTVGKRLPDKAAGMKNVHKQGIFIPEDCKIAESKVKLMVGDRLPENGFTLRDERCREEEGKKDA